MEFFVILVGAAATYYVYKRWYCDQPIVLKSEHTIRPVRFLPIKQSRIYELPIELASDPMEIDDLSPNTRFITDYILKDC